jgi:peptidylprolyl isomerase
MRKLLLITLTCLAVVAAGCGGDSSSGDTTGSTGSTSAEGTSTSTEEESTAEQPESAVTKPKVTVPSGPPPKQLESKDLKVGDGPAAKAGNEVTVQYVGVGYKSKEQFDASWDRGEPFTFVLGSNSVIPGWEQGVVGMKVGGRRELTIPPELAYGPAGAPPAIGPNETLIFVIDLVAAK